MTRRIIIGGTIIAALAVAGCARDGHTGIGMFNQPAKASAASLEEARRVDAVQRLYHDGLYDRARVALDQLLADGSRHPQALLLKAKLTRQEGDQEGAITWCGKAIEASPLWIDPRILLAQIYLKLERHSAAASVFEDIVRMAPHGPWGYYGQGAVAAMRGDHAQATVFADQALERDPDHEPSIRLRGQLARLAGDTATEERLLVRLAALEPLDADVRLRLGELAQAGGRLEDAGRQFQRAYSLEPRPTTAAKLATLARQNNDPEGERRWMSRAGGSQLPADPNGQPADPATPPEVQ